MWSQYAEKEICKLHSILLSNIHWNLYKRTLLVLLLSSLHAQIIFIPFSTRNSWNLKKLRFFCQMLNSVVHRGELLKRRWWNSFIYSILRSLRRWYGWWWLQRRWYCVGRPFLFLTWIWRHICETNLHSVQQTGNSINTNKDEIEQYLGILVLMGTFVFPEMRMYRNCKLRYFQSLISYKKMDFLKLDSFPY